ncbi:MAG: hypothetical protein FWD86_01310 [Firmicutes bacterium]|nr:hypothetical protein [Bacillota bacterium]
MDYLKNGNAQMNTYNIKTKTDKNQIKTDKPQVQNSDKQLFLLIDGNSLINRAFYAVPPLTGPDGTPTNAIYGFVNMLIKGISDFAPTHIAVAFDLKGPTFRHLLSPDYKATRKGMPDELAAQLPLLKQILTEMGIKIVQKQGLEADDLIGSLAQNPIKTVIVTGDKDAFSLIDECTKVAYTKQGITNIALYDTDLFVAEYGFLPKNLPDFKAIAGDKSDNILGVDGIGEKGASDLIKQFGSVENVYLNLDLIKPTVAKRLKDGRESAFLSKRLATIDKNVALDLGVEDCGFCMPFKRVVRDRFESLKFSLVKRSELFEGDDEGGKRNVQLSFF